MTITDMTVSMATTTMVEPDCFWRTGQISQSMRHLSLHVNDRESQITSGSRLSQLGDTCVEDNWKLAVAFSSVLPVLGFVPSSSRVGARAVFMSGWLGWVGLTELVEGVPVLK